MKNTKDKALIVFAKFPVEGKVKTRLAEEIGKKNATEFYRVCAEHVFLEFLEIKDHGIYLFLFYSVESYTEQIKKWVGDGFYHYVQTGNDLGDKMKNAFNQVFSKGCDKVLIVGTDVPDLNSNLLVDAFDELEENDFVIGPSDDGGYYMLGMKTFTEDLFRGIKWSSETVLGDTLRIIESKNASVKIMREMIDIDTKEDLVRWYRKDNIASNHPVKIFVESIKEFI